MHLDHEETLRRVHKIGFVFDPPPYQYSSSSSFSRRGEGREGGGARFSPSPSPPIFSDSSPDVLFDEILLAGGYDDASSPHHRQKPSLLERLFQSPASRRYLFPALFLFGLSSLYVGLSPPSSSSALSSSLLVSDYFGSRGARGAGVPFQQISRSPIAGLSRSSPVLLLAPLPTGAFWTNFILSLPESPGASSFVVSADPLQYKFDPSLGLQVSYSGARRTSSGAALVDVFQPDVTFSGDERPSGAAAAHEPHDKLELSVDGHSSLSVTVTVSSSSLKVPLFSSPVVRGSPFVTVTYYSPGVVVVPSLSTLQPLCFLASLPSVALTGEDGGAAAARLFDAACDEEEGKARESSGDRFLFKTKETTFLLVLSKPTTLTWVAAGTSLQMSASDSSSSNSSSSSPLTVRLLIFAPSHLHLPPSSKSALLRFFVSHSRIVPLSGSAVVSFPLPLSPSPIPLSYSFDTTCITAGLARRNGCNSDDLLIFGLPHHSSVRAKVWGAPKSDELGLKILVEHPFFAVTGAMEPFVGSVWEMSVPQQSRPELSFPPFRSSSPSVLDRPLSQLEVDALQPKGLSSFHDGRPLVAGNSTYRALLLKTLFRDFEVLTPRQFTRDAYGLGKQLSRLANLGVVAAEMRDEGLTTSIAKRLRAELEKALAMPGEGDADVDAFVYDLEYGGVVTSDGVKDKMADFGNGMYNVRPTYQPTHTPHTPNPQNAY